jgi:hypothetical protein
LALPKHEFGLDVLAFIGTQRYAHHASVPTIHQALIARGLAVAPRTVTNLLERYDELVALSLQDTARLRRLTQPQGRVILALDGLQPDVGQEVLWVLRDCLSGEVLLARSLLSATHDDLAALLCEVKQALEVPIGGVITDGQLSIRAAVAQALPEVPHQLCHFHYLHEAAKPIYEADRHAKKVLKKHVRGVRPIERRLEGRSDREAEVVRGYCAAKGVPSPTMVARLWRLPGSNSTIDSTPLPRAWSGWKKGGLAQSPRAPEDDPAARAGRDGVAVARGAGGLWLGAPRRAHPEQ